MKNDQRGSLLLPIIVVIAILVAGGALIAWPNNIPPISTEETATGSANNQASGNASTASFTWTNGGPNQVSGRIAAGGRGLVKVNTGQTERLQLEVTTAPNAQVELQSPSGEILTTNQIGPTTVSIAKKTDPQSGKLVTTYDVTNHPQGGSWQVAIDGSATNQASDYSVSAPIATPPLTISPTVDSSNTSQTVTIAIVVQESNGGQTQAVSGAQVTANITNPNDQTVTIILQETDQVNNPGTYSGTYTGDQVGGVYNVEYVINGENANGESFEQTTTGQFVIEPDPNQTISSYTKKYDINRGNDVQLIGY